MEKRGPHAAPEGASAQHSGETTWPLSPPRRTHPTSTPTTPPNRHPHIPQPHPLPSRAPPSSQTHAAERTRQHCNQLRLDLSRQHAPAAVVLPNLWERNEAGSVVLGWDCGLSQSWHASSASRRGTNQPACHHEGPDGCTCVASRLGQRAAARRLRRAARQACRYRTLASLASSSRKKLSHFQGTSTSRLAPAQHAQRGSGAAGSAGRARPDASPGRAGWELRY